jgi:uncharacterized protein YndB with AHSA1/START domain
LITVALSAAIGSPHERVWRALVDPRERSIWDERILGEVALSQTPRKTPKRTREQDRKAPLRTTRWRFRLGRVPLVLQEEVMRADGHDRIVSRISIGSMHFDQTLTLHDEDDESGPRTRVGMKVVATNSIAVIGEVVPRLDVQKLVIEYIDATLRQVRKHCEADA